MEQKKHLQRMFSLDAWKKVNSETALCGCISLLLQTEVSLLYFLETEINTEFLQSLKKAIYSFIGISLLFFILISTHPALLKLITSL